MIYMEHESSLASRGSMQNIKSNHVRSDVFMTRIGGGHWKMSVVDRDEIWHIRFVAF